MPSVRSNLLPGVSALFWKIARYDPPPTLSLTLTSITANEGKSGSDSVVGTQGQSPLYLTLQIRHRGRYRGARQEEEVGTVSPHSPGSRAVLDKQESSGNWKTFSENLSHWQVKGRSRDSSNNVKNADKLGGLVEDIRDAVMDYQVRNRSGFTSHMSDIYFRLRYSKIFTTRAAN